MGIFVLFWFATMICTKWKKYIKWKRRVVRWVLLSWHDGMRHETYMERAFIAEESETCLPADIHLHKRWRNDETYINVTATTCILKPKRLNAQFKKLREQKRKTIWNFPRSYISRSIVEVFRAERANWRCSYDTDAHKFYMKNDFRRKFPPNSNSKANKWPKTDNSLFIVNFYLSATFGRSFVHGEICIFRTT